MFPTTKKVDIGNAEVICYDFTYGYILGMEDKTIEDTVLNAVENGTDFSKEQVKELRGSQVELLYNAILQLSYPHAYNADGTLKKEKQDSSKKKA